MSDAFAVDGFDELERDVRALPAMALDAAEEAMRPALVFLESRQPPYPGAARAGQSAKYWTTRQRRWFFWALAKGLIHVPYRRTGKLGQSFTSAVTRDEASVTGEWGTNARIAPWVVGASFPGEVVRGQTMYQARIHQGRWFQFDKLWEENKDATYDLFYAGFRESLSRRWAERARVTP